MFFKALKHKTFNITPIVGAIFIIFSIPTSSFASPQITEIMYDLPGTDTGREWIEIYNPDNTSIDIAKLKLFEADTNHSLVSVSGGDSLGPNSYAVIADKPESFKTDFPNYTGTLYDSTFSLSNSGETLVFKLDGNIEDSVTYNPALGAGGDGNSLQKINNIWVASLPTPGIENALSSQSSTTTNNTNTSNTDNTASTTSPTEANKQTNTVTVVRYISLHSSPEDLSIYKEDPSFELSAGRERMAYIGTPLEFNATHKLSKTLEWAACSFKWSYGDGHEEIAENPIHMYKYSGEYTVILNGSCGDKKAVSRTKVKVLKPNLSMFLSTDGNLEIKNNGDVEINLGLWKLKDDVNVFTFPQDTIITPAHSIILSTDDTKIKIDNSKIIYLFNPIEKEIVKVVNTESNSNIYSSTDITVEKAEVLLDEYKRSLGQKNKQDSLVGDNTESIKETFSKKIPTNTATVVESIESSSTKGFWSKLFELPSSGLKHIFSSFYSF